MITLHNKIVYSYKLDNKKSKSFSLVVTEDTKTIKHIPNLFKSQKDAERFVTLCNKHKLSPVHIEDFIEDFFT